MSAPFGFGIIGAGVVSGWHAQGIRAHPDGRIVAVWNRTPEKAEKFAAEHGCAIERDWRELIRRDDIQAICVCTASGFHAEQSIAALEAGKHVLVEKPMAVNLADALRMIEAARANKVKLAVSYQLRTGEAVQRIRQAVADGAFGKLVFADASLKYWRNQAYYDSAGWRGTWELDGGGCTMNQGSHGIDLLIYIAGEVERIFAKMATVAHNIDVEDAAIALLTFKNGAFGRLQTATAVNPGQGIRIEINGDRGSAQLSDDKIKSWAVSESREALAAETMGEQSAKLGGAASSSTGFAVQGYIIEMANLIEAVREGKPLICPGEEGIKSINLIMALYESARRGEEVALAEMMESAKG